MEEIKIIEGKNSIHLFSGGLDSAYALLKLAKERKETNNDELIHPVFFDYGQNAAPTEWSQVQQLVQHISVLEATSTIQPPIKIDLRSDLFTWCQNVAFTGREVGDESPEIQNRNMVLLSILFSYLLACAQNQKIAKTIYEISSGFKEGEMGDCSADFINALSTAFALYHAEIQMNIILLPAISRKKVYSEIKRLLRGNQEKLKRFYSMTTSCYSPINGEPCGKCLKCKRIDEEKLE